MGEGDGAGGETTSSTDGGSTRVNGGGDENRGRDRQYAEGCGDSRFHGDHSFPVCRLLVIGACGGVQRFLLSCFLSV
jgi:hypothetical protein